MMNKKNLPHIITVVSFVVFIVLGLASATSPDVKNVASIDELTNLRDKFAWLKTHAESGGNYVLEVNEDSSIGNIDLSFKNKSNITITLRGIGERRSVSTYQKGSIGGIFMVGSGVTFILDDNILLRGVPTGSSIDTLASVVCVYSGGTFIMNNGSGIEGNMSFEDGGGVYVSDGGTFLMNGGLIAGNTCFQIQSSALAAASGGKANAWSETPRRGGGVFVAVGGAFTKTGGTITGYSSGAKDGNVTKSFNGLSVSQGNGHAVFAALGKRSSIFVTETGSKRKETTAGPDANLRINSDGTFSGNWDF
jgi:hypothetical protein